MSTQVRIEVYRGCFRIVMFMEKALLLLSLIFFLLCTTHTYAGENLLQNGGFEQELSGLPDRWSTDVYGSTRFARFYTESRGARIGEKCVTIENLQKTDAKLIQHITVKPKTVYRLSCWIRASGIGTGALGANISVLNILETSHDLKDTKGTWQYVELYGITGPRQRQLAVTARLGGYANVNTGKASFDAFMVEEVGHVPPDTRVVKLFAETTHTPVRTPQWLKRSPSLPAVFAFALIFLGTLYAVYILVFKQNRPARGRVSYTIAGYIIILVGSFIVRILIAPAVKGVSSDISCFTGWALTAAGRGFADFYSAGTFVDYPPGYIYVLYIIGLAKGLFSLSTDSPTFLCILKLPAMLADIVTSLIIFFFARSRMGDAKASALSLLYALNPAVIYNSAAYGQVDSFFTLFICVCVLLVFKERLVAAVVVFTAAVLIKPQALIFTPIGLFALFQKRSLKTLWLCLAAMAITFIVIILPFSLKQEPLWVFKLYLKTLSSYPYASLNAFNLFSLAGGNWVKETEPFLVLSYKVWGMFFIVALVAFATFLSVKSREQQRPFLLSLFIMAAVYVLASKMHERYLFPALVFAVMSFITTRDRRLLLLYGGFTITLFINQAMLVDLVMAENVYWIPKNDPVLRILSGCNVVLLIYTVVVAVDICVRKKVKEVVLRDAPPSSAPPVPASVTREPERVFLSRNDYMLMGILTLVYAVAAVVNLGSLKAPQTYWRPANRGESFFIDLGKQQRIERVCYYLGLGKGSFRIAFSPDGTDWHKSRIIKQKSRYEALEWRHFKPRVTAQYMKITAEAPGTMLNEIGLFAPGGTKPIPIGEIQESRAGPPGLGVPLHEGRPAHVFDEQHTVAVFGTFYNGMYFDERYHARTAYEHLHRIEPSETTHPPLGKVIISLGIALFGMTPFGWRIMGTLLGVAMVPLMYMFGKRLFKKTEYAFIASFLMAFDFMHFTQTRIATIDVYGVFFIILMYYFMYQYYCLNFYQVKLSRTFVPLFFSGVFFGMGAASKWNVLYAAVGLALILFAVLARRFIECLGGDHGQEPGEPGASPALFCSCTVKTLLFCVVAFIIVPGMIYVLSYIPFMRVPGPGHGLFDVVTYQKHMYTYHSQLEATHPFSSPWWQWPIMLKPIWYYGGQRFLAGDNISSIVAMGNPAVWWPGIFAVAAGLIVGIVRRSRVVFFLFAGLASVYVPWIIAPRKLTFIYHFFPAVPFIILFITFILKILKERFSRMRFCVYGYLAIVLILFAMFYPVLSGAVVSKSYAALFLRWFKSWIFYL